MDVSSIRIREVGPREGFQFEGIGQPDKISTDQKVRLVEALSRTGVRNIEVTSFVSPKQVPQMADAEAVSAALTPREGVTYSALYLNARGLERAIDAGVYEIRGSISLTASETFCKKNQNVDSAGEVEMQRKKAEMYAGRGIPVDRGGIMAAFGCNYEGDVPLDRVLQCAETLQQLADETGSEIASIGLADTMGWADPEQIKRTVSAFRENWPSIDVALHLHDTRGTGLANVYAALECGVTEFDTSVGGLGGCPFAQTVAGNVATEDVVFMCERMGIDTGIDLEAMVECVRLAEEIVGHPLPSKVGHVM